MALCLGLGLSAMPAAEGAPKRDSARMKRILVLGDSLSDGFTLPRRQAYPALLAEKLRAAGLRFEVVNESASGDNTAGGLRRLGRHLKQPVDILVVQLGINDLFQGVPLETIRSNLQAIIEQTRAASPGVRIVVVGMQLPNYTEENNVTDVWPDLCRAGAGERGGVCALFAGRRGGQPGL